VKRPLHQTLVLSATRAQDPEQADAGVAPVDAGGYA